MKIQDLKTMAVIGAGDMGHGIAQMALMNGYDVTICDIKEEFVQRGKTRIMDSLQTFCKKGKVDAALVEKIESELLHTTTSLEEAVKNADMIIEAVPEIFDLKVKTLQDVDRYAPAHAIIATNTSTMSITKFAAATNRPDKVVGMHYFNPVVLMKLVEVIRCEFSSDETVQLACDYVNKIGKTLILANKDTPGFIANRINAPCILYGGLCLDVDGLSAADIDVSMQKAGQKMGPMELADYTGVDVQNCCVRYYHDNLSEEYVPSRHATELENTKCVGKKAGRGYYEWPEKGRPVIPEEAYTGKFDPNMWFIIQANEACKLVEDGICTFEDCDNAMIYGFNSYGPIAFVQEMAPADLAAALDGIADKYGKEVFRATNSIRTGAYLRK